MVSAMFQYDPVNMVLYVHLDEKGCVWKVLSEIVFSKLLRYIHSCLTVVTVATVHVEGLIGHLMY